MKNKLINIFLILALVAGLSLLLYPTVSDYWNSLHASQAVASYDQAVKSMDEGKYDELLQRAGQYNRDLFLRGTLFALTDEEREDYNSQLDIDGSGVMGYIEIPTIKVSLPIYHGTSDDVLQVAVGHLEWSSLPVGGESTHCVLSGPPRPSQRQALYKSGPAHRGRFICHPHARRGAHLRGRPYSHCPAQRGSGPGRGGR